MKRCEFAERLQERRRNIGWTYAKVAEAAGIAESSVYRVLNGQTTPLLPHADAIARALGMHLALMDGGDPR